MFRMSFPARVRRLFSSPKKDVERHPLRNGQTLHSIHLRILRNQVALSELRQGCFQCRLSKSHTGIECRAEVVEIVVGQVAVLEYAESSGCAEGCSIEDRVKLCVEGR